MFVSISNSGKLPDIRIAIDGLTVLTGTSDSEKGMALNAIYRALRPIDMHNVVTTVDGTMIVPPSSGEHETNVSDVCVHLDRSADDIPIVMYYDTPFIMDSSCMGSPGDHRHSLWSAIHSNYRCDSTEYIMPERMVRMMDDAIGIQDGDGLRMDNGAKIFEAIRALAKKGFLNRGSVLILDEPSAYLHPIRINILAGIVSILITDIGARIVMSTNDPHMLMAIEDSVLSHGLNAHYYDISDGPDGIVFTETTDDLQPVYAAMAEPIIEISTRFL